MLALSLKTTQGMLKDYIRQPSAKTYVLKWLIRRTQLATQGRGATGHGLGVSRLLAAFSFDLSSASSCIFICNLQRSIGIRGPPTVVRLSLGLSTSTEPHGSFSRIKTMLWVVKSVFLLSSSFDVTLPSALARYGIEASLSTMRPAGFLRS